MRGPGEAGGKWVVKEVRVVAGKYPALPHLSLLLGRGAGRSRAVGWISCPMGTMMGQCHWVTAEPGMGEAPEKKRQTLWLGGGGG